MEARSPRLTVGARASRARGFAALLLVLASVATALGADAARHPLEAGKLAESALRLALVRGNDDPQVRAALVELCRELARSPLDSRTRAVYASLLTGLSRRMEDCKAASFHARRAAELAPVTVSVVRATALVLAHCGETDRALELTRDIFTYDAPAAALTLSQLAPLVDRPIDAGIPATPAAWLAWAHQLLHDGRVSEGTDWLERTCRRWPDHWPALETLAVVATNHEDWAMLESLFPAGRELPDEPAAARPLLQRARLRAHQGDLAAARVDIERALALDGGTTATRILGGDAYESVGEFDLARRSWNRALFALADHDPARPAVLGRLARLEERHGQPAAALRWWQALLELDPADAEARRRVDDLSGFRR